MNKHYTLHVNVQIQRHSVLKYRSLDEWTHCVYSP